jgi:hypothetical protein
MVTRANAQAARNAESELVANVPIAHVDARRSSESERIIAQHQVAAGLIRRTAVI